MVISYTSTTEKPCWWETLGMRLCWTNQMPVIDTVSWNCQMFQVNFIPSPVADRKTAIWCFVQLCFLSHSVKTIDGSPSCSHQATTAQPLNRPQYLCYGKPLKKHGNEALHWSKLWNIVVDYNKGKISFMLQKQWKGKKSDQ